MRPRQTLLVSLVLLACAILVAGCTVPGGQNVTAPPTTVPATTPAGTITTVPATTPAETATVPTTIETTAPTTTTTATPVPGGENQTVTLNIAADNMAFDTDTITVPAGAEVTINFDNRDDGIPHNLAVYEDSTARDPIFQGQIVTGPAAIEYTVTAPEEPGTYYFQCDVHPEQMNGDFIVE